MDAGRIATDEMLADMEDRLTEIYTRASKDLEKKAEKYFQQFERLDAEKKALVDAGKMTEKEYKTWRKNKVMTGKHWTAMKEQSARALANVNKTALEYANGQLPEVYAINYNATGKGVGEAVKGVSFELVDANTVKNLATKNVQLLPYKELDIPKDMRWNMRTMQSEVLQGILQGESMNDIAKRIFPEINSKTDFEGKTAKEVKGLIKKNRDAAIRNARTMVTGAENRGRMDMLHDAAAKGVQTQKGWLAAHDSRVRDSHAEIDGEYVDMDDEFSNGLMYPGDPGGDPSEVYNCRCTLTYKVVGFGGKRR